MKALIGLSSPAIFLMMILSIHAGWLGQGITGEGPVLDESRDVAAFSEIVLDGSIDARITAADTQSVMVRAQQNILPLIVTEVSGD
ncbi:MAG TPA: DUF2807 domain-containing protein, partial [bacterium]|nr:DUF2807 domain-containing protein [bacterium]